MENALAQVLHYLVLLEKRKGVFFLVSLATMTALIVGVYFLPKKYQADSTVFIEKSVINSLVQGMVVTTDIRDRVRVLRQAMLSRNLVESVLKDLDVDVRFKTEGQLQGYISSLQNRTEISVSREDLFRVSIVDQDPRFAQNYVNTLINKYLEQNLSASRQETYGANRFLQEQLDLFKKKLDEAEDRIIQYRKQQGIFLSIDEGAIIEDIKQYHRDLDGIAMELDRQKARRERLVAQLKEISPQVSIFSEQGGGVSRIRSLENRIKVLLLSYTEDYPEVIRLRAELAVLKRSMGSGGGGSLETRSVNPLYQDVRQQIVTVEGEISALEAASERLKNMIAAREKELKEVPENRKTLGVLIQQRDSIRNTYQDLLTRMGRAEVSKQMEIGDKAATFRVVDPAILPTIPISPNRVRLIFMAIFAGAGAGAGLVILLESLDTSVKKISQLREMGLEVLAVIPQMTDALVERKAQMRDRIIYVSAGCYFGMILCLWAAEAFKIKIF
ncbi:MAG: chain length-determining protein [Deltaproteobacteria bacterium]|nr:chain length-determining protein [Deltaproteobacteria bacterium]